MRQNIFLRIESGNGGRQERTVSPSPQKDIRHHNLSSETSIRRAIDSRRSPKLHSSQPSRQAHVSKTRQMINGFIMRKIPCTRPLPCPARNPIPNFGATFWDALGIAIGDPRFVRFHICSYHILIASFQMNCARERKADGGRRGQIPHKSACTKFSRCNTGSDRFGLPGEPSGKAASIRQCPVAVCIWGTGPSSQKTAEAPARRRTRNYVS